MTVDPELAACTPNAVDPAGFNSAAQLPYGLTVDNVKVALGEVLDLLGFMNTQLNARSTPRLETLLMPANFSSMVGELMVEFIPHQTTTMAKNRYHNGYPDLVPANTYQDDKAQHGEQGIEVKSSRYKRGWQGHNVEKGWFMVFMFDANRPRDLADSTAPRPLEFVRVAAAELMKSDWKFSGRSATSRRTITASIVNSGYDKMMANIIYEAP